MRLYKITYLGVTGFVKAKDEESAREGFDVGLTNDAPEEPYQIEEMSPKSLMDYIMSGQYDEFMISPHFDM